jgi:hypothetical protein
MVIVCNEGRRLFPAKDQPLRPLRNDLAGVEVPPPDPPRHRRPLSAALVARHYLGRRALAHLPRHTTTRRSQCGTAFRLGTGSGTSRACKSFNDFLDSLGIPCSFIIRPGGHDWPLWKEGLELNLRFHSRNFSRL